MQRPCGRMGLAGQRVKAGENGGRRSWGAGFQATARAPHSLPREKRAAGGFEQRKDII